MMKGKLNHKLFLFVMLTLFLGGAVIFLFGFFPIAYQRFDKAPQNDFNNSRPTSINGKVLKLPTQKYEQIILMLVDALRYDFVTDDLMPQTHQSRCNLLKLLVSVPTVTMPRIKSLTTGTISNFIDIILNLGHTEQLEDSILHQLYKRGDLITFAGDRTWVNLFPDKFHRKAANIDSFFVNDFYEGDDNVTRTMETELQHSDWKLLILHYLGLDHIGHVEGTSSSKLPLKLKEMDYVVSKIYSSKHLRGQMLLLTSDHGMRDGGGHGGSTQEELNVPLIFFTEHCETKSSIYTNHKQIDVAPTLAILFSIDIPKSSIGCLLPELLEELSLEDQLYAYYYNAHHLINKAVAKYGEEFVNEADYFASYVKAQWAHTQFLKAINSKSTMATLIFEQTKSDYIKLSRHISDELSKSLGGFHYDLISIGLMLGTLSTLYTLISVFLEHGKPRYKLDVKKVAECFAVSVAINLFCHTMDFIEKSGALRSCLLTVPIAAAIYITQDIVRVLFLPQLPLRLHKQLRLSLPLLTPLTAFLLFHIISLGSSSFIEEEDEMWYYLGGTMTIVLLISTYGSNVSQDYDLLGPAIYNSLQRETWQMRWALLVPIITALLRRHNNYFVAMLSKAENRHWLSWGLAGGLFALLLQLLKFNRKLIQSIICSVALGCVYCFRGSVDAVCFFDIPSLRALPLSLFWISIGLLAALGFKSVISLRKHDIFAFKPRTTLLSEFLQMHLTCSLLIAVLLHKPHNVALVPAMIFMLHKCYELYDRLHCHARSKTPNHLYALLQKTLLTIIVGKIFYFCQGNSNSLATIDLNPGYIGQSSYNPFVVAILVTLNTYSAPINAFLYLMMHIAGGENLTAGNAHESTQDILGQTVKSRHSEEELFHIAISVYTAATLLPVTVYMWLLVLFRYHLFIYSVFSPKVLYECFSVLVFYLLFILTSLYSVIFK